MFAIYMFLAYFKLNARRWQARVPRDVAAGCLYDRTYHAIPGECCSNFTERRPSDSY